MAGTQRRSAREAARDWAAGATTAAMTARWPFAEFGAWAEACERDRVAVRFPDAESALARVLTFLDG
ncbi:hypothetical protein [Amycolatopsis rifamycinica]|uniref:hypothetical protein n=1 Tax=Amycolatopsis rifamycinica TaxID=287986 RepID=UPI000B28147C|nr:hypothetical protein [Amycolatopsis rifamycinica]